ncbi:FMN-binding protein [Candidatus Nitrospira salsa]
MLTIHRRSTIITACYVGLILFVFSGMIATTAHAKQQLERIWDHELNRWLNAEELGHLEVYFTEEEAAKVMFPDSDNIRKATLSLNPEQKKLVEEQIGWKFPETSFTTYIGETGGKADGYAMVQNTIGKHRPITYMVSVDTEGEVTNFEVLVYREARGNEIATKRFNYQYQGKDLRDPIRINRDIINISGATMSVRSASAGVKRVLVLVNEFYLKPLGLGTNTLVAGNAEKGFLESILGF